jgi:conjugal transfer pilus assembly protein TraI
MQGFDHILSSLGLQRAKTHPVFDTNPPHVTPGQTQSGTYPPVDPGIPAESVDTVLIAHQDLIDRIKICYGVDRDTFERELLAVIRRYAAFVHLLPATPDNYFNAPGGLFRMGLEVAFFSLQGTDGHIFSGRSTITTRRHLEPRWRQATFIAGLCTEIHRTLCQVIVTNEHGDEWQPYLHPLASWLASHQAARFYLKWRPNVHESRALGVFALPHVVPAEMLQHLATGNSVIVPHMLSCVSGMPLYRDHNILDDLVRRATALVIDRFLQASADRYGKPQLGSHLERYLVDALRRLVASNAAWLPNSEKSRVWYGRDGLFILWPFAATDVRDLLEADHLPGIPKAPDTILEILIAAGAFEPQDATHPIWQIAPPGLTPETEAVKLSSPAILLAGLDPVPQPLARSLVRTTVEPATQPASPPTASQAQAANDLQQLSLPIPSEPCAAAQTATPLAPQSPENAEAPATRLPASTPSQRALPIQAFKLDAPLRLNPAVREALEQIIDTMNRDGSNVAACTVSSGLFIPLSEFERRKTEPSQAQRALDDVKMLVHPAGSSQPTLVRDFGGEQKIGLLIHPRFIAGLDPGNFDIPDSSGAPC